MVQTFFNFNSLDQNSMISFLLKDITWKRLLPGLILATLFLLNFQETRTSALLNKRPHVLNWQVPILKELFLNFFKFWYAKSTWTKPVWNVYPPVLKELPACFKTGLRLFRNSRLPVLNKGRPVSFRRVPVWIRQALVLKYAGSC